jgi:hypothetical protein
MSQFNFRGCCYLLILGCILSSQLSWPWLTYGGHNIWIGDSSSLTRRRGKKGPNTQSCLSVCLSVYLQGQISYKRRFVLLVMNKSWRRCGSTMDERRNNLGCKQCSIHKHIPDHHVSHYTCHVCRSACLLVVNLQATILPRPLHTNPLDMRT